MEIKHASSADSPQLTRYMILSGGLLVGFFILGQLNFLIFHSLGEMLSIAIAWSVFTLSWNSQKIVRNDNLLIVGIAYLSVGLIDSLHMLAYKGIGVFSPEFAANYATQLWIASRILETFSLLLFAFSFRRNLNAWYLLLGYAGITTGLLMSIFYWKIFPACYIEGYGLTPFKVGAEYFIVVALLSAIIILHKNRHLLDRTVYLLMVGAMAATIASELIFTLYVGLYGLSNILGHILKIVSYILVYNALVRSSLSRPYVTLFREIESEKRAVIESEKKFRNMINNLPLGIHIFQKGEDNQLYFVGANAAADTILGIDKQQLINRTITEAFPEIADADIQADFYAIATGETDSVNKAGITYRDRIYDKYNFQVQDGMMASTFLDITERKQAEDALREAKETAESYLNISAELIFRLDAQGTITLMNDSGHWLLGYNPGELIGKNWFDTCLPEKIRSEILAVFQKLMNGDIANVTTYENTVITKNGNIRSLLWHNSLLKGKNGRINGLLSSARDITKRKQVEEALAQSDSLRELLLDIITHDLKNPAGVIYALSETARKDLPENKFLEAIYTSSGRLIKVLNQTTILSQAAFGEAIPKEPLSLNTMINETVAEFESALNTAEMDLEVAIAPNLIIEANPLIAEVFNNYISNAIKYAREGKRIVIESILEDQTVMVCVKDFGKTIAKADREQVFQRQVQLENGKGRGRGLGLAIVKRIADAHNGEVWVEPNTPKGNSFCLRIPR